MLYYFYLNKIFIVVIKKCKTACRPVRQKPLRDFLFAYLAFVFIPEGFFLFLFVFFFLYYFFVFLCICITFVFVLHLYLYFFVLYYICICVCVYDVDERWRLISTHLHRSRRRTHYETAATLLHNHPTPRQFIYRIKLSYI